MAPLPAQQPRVRRRPAAPSAATDASEPLSRRDVTQLRFRASHLAKDAARTAFRAAERAGVHLLPAHFYSPVADRRWLARHPDLWRLPAGAAAIGAELDAQLRWLRERTDPYVSEVAGFSFVADVERAGLTFRYGLVEGQVLHSVVRALAPRRIVEIGSGASTLISSQAARANAAEGRGATELTAIDPFAPDALDGLGDVDVVREPAQTVGSERFAALQAGDLLFIDSTHVVKAGSELGRIYLEILPSLAPGVVVHVHDIYLPYLFSPWIMTDPWDWQETTLLAALLTANPALQVRCCLSALHDARQAELRAILPDYRPLALDRGLAVAGAEGHYPSSIWLTTRGV